MVDACPPGAVLDGRGSGPSCEVRMSAGASADQGVQRCLGAGVLGVQAGVGVLVGREGSDDSQAGTRHAGDVYHLEGIEIFL